MCFPGSNPLLQGFPITSDNIKIGIFANFSSHGSIPISIHLLLLSFCRFSHKSQTKTSSSSMCFPGSNPLLQGFPIVSDNIIKIGILANFSSCAHFDSSVQLLLMPFCRFSYKSQTTRSSSSMCFRSSNPLLQGFPIASNTVTLRLESLPAFLVVLILIAPFRYYGCGFVGFLTTAKQKN
jgi:hypothetical protein